MPLVESWKRAMTIRVAGALVSILALAILGADTSPAAAWPTTGPL